MKTHNLIVNQINPDTDTPDIISELYAEIERNFKLPKLSAYTSAGNCTDLTDLMHGIHEMQEWKKLHQGKMPNKKLPKTWYIKWYKLNKKLTELSQSKLF